MFGVHDHDDHRDRRCGRRAQSKFSETNRRRQIIEWRGYERHAAEHAPSAVAVSGVRHLNGRGALEQLPVSEPTGEVASVQRSRRVQLPVSEPTGEVASVQRSRRVQAPVLEAFEVASPHTNLQQLDHFFAALAHLDEQEEFQEESYELRHCDVPLSFESQMQLALRLSGLSTAIADSARRRSSEAKQKRLNAGPIETRQQRKARSQPGCRTSGRKAHHARKVPRQIIET